MACITGAGAVSSVIRVGGSAADIRGYDSDAIQIAADAMKLRGGGTIELSGGIFDIYGPVRLFGRTRLTGKGSGTVLKKTAGFSSAFAQDVDYGVLCARVSDVGGFRVGMGIQIKDSASSAGYVVSSSKITAVEGDTIHFDRRTVMDYLGERGGEISNACSIIEVIKADYVTISDLSIDGSKEGNLTMDSCRGGAIYIHKARGCSVENVLVRDFDGDGISWQITEDIAVTGVEVSGCTGNGLHPGTGSERSRVEGCRLHGNGGDGMFVCWRVCNGIFRNSEFISNGSAGICIGHRDTDNLFEGNIMRGNARAGIMIRDESEGNRADRNTYRRNAVEDNGGPEGGSGFLFLSAVQGNVIEENTIRDTGCGKQRTGVSGRGLSVLSVRKNEMSGHACGDVKEFSDI